MTGQLIYRVQARLGHYGPTTSTRTRYFAREVDAWRFAARVHAGGGVAHVAVAERGPWVVADDEVTR